MSSLPANVPDRDSSPIDDGDEVLRMFMMSQDVQSGASGKDSQQDLQRPVGDYFFPQEDTKVHTESMKAVASFEHFFKKLEKLQ